MNTPEVTSKLIPKKSLSVIVHVRWMATAVQHGRYLHCPDGSHMAMYDDQERYVHGLIDFIHYVNAGRFKGKATRVPCTFPRRCHRVPSADLSNFSVLTSCRNRGTL